MCSCMNAPSFSKWQVAQSVAETLNSSPVWHEVQTMGVASYPT
jgi:hypothetical protein